MTVSEQERKEYTNFVDDGEFWYEPLEMALKLFFHTKQNGLLVHAEFQYVPLFCIEDVYGGFL